MKAAFKYLIIFLLINIFVGLVTLLLGYLVCAMYVPSSGIHFLVWRKCWLIPGTLLYHCYCVTWSFC